MPLTFQLDDHLFPVQAFFNAMLGRSFFRNLEFLSQGMGLGLNYPMCEFPGDPDPGEEDFVGMRFSIFSEEVILSNEAFLAYLSQACAAHLETQPHDAELVTALLNKVASRFETG